MIGLKRIISPGAAQVKKLINAIAKRERRKRRHGKWIERAKFDTDSTHKLLLRSLFQDTEIRLIQPTKFMTGRVDKNYYSSAWCKWESWLFLCYSFHPPLTLFFLINRKSINCQGAFPPPALSFTPFTHLLLLFYVYFNTHSLFFPPKWVGGLHGVKRGGWGWAGRLINTAEKTIAKSINNQARPARLSPNKMKGGNEKKRRDRGIW